MTEDPLSAYRQIPEAEAAGFLAVDCRTLQKFRRDGGGPKFVRVSRSCVRYRIADLIDWQEARLRSSTAEECAV